MTTPSLNSPRFSFGKWLEFIGPAIALIVIFLVFMILVPDWHENKPITYQLTRFANFDNISSILRQSCMTAVAALGMTFIIIAGGIDLSAGSLAAFTGVIIAVVIKNGTSTDPELHKQFLASPLALPFLAAAAGCACGILAGLLNGALVTGLRIVPFIITLGTMMVIRGAAKHFGHESTVSNIPNWLWSIMAPLSDNQKWMLFPPAIWITLFLAVATSLILNYSRFGRQVIAVGSNEQTARLCGIPVARTKLLVYMLGGLFTGIGGLFFYSYTTNGAPTSADGFELDVIAAVVIGGASLSGGKGSIFGSLVGALILTVIARGCSQIHIPDFMRGIIDSPVGLPSYIQQIVTGIIIIIAALIDRLRQKRPT